MNLNLKLITVLSPEINDLSLTATCQLVNWWNKENLVPTSEWLLEKGPWAWETVEIRKAMLEGDDFWHEDTKDSDFKL